LVYLICWWFLFCRRTEGDGEERISDTKGHSQQNQGEGAAEAAMVLPDVSEAVS